MKQGTRRSALFFLLLGAACFALYGLDEQMLFAYMPYWLALMVCAAILVPLVPKGPWVIKTTALCLFAVWLLAILPKSRSSELKGFYVDAWSLQRGMSIAQADEIMAKYAKNPLGPLSGAHMVGIVESKGEHDARILYTHKDHPADWCVVYPQDGIVQRVVIHPD